MINLYFYKNWDETLRSKWRASIRHWPNTKLVRNGGPIAQVVIIEHIENGKEKKVVSIVTMRRPKGLKQLVPLIAEGLEEVLKKSPNALGRKK